MKDKLVKYHRKASYYRMRKTAVLSIAFLVGMASVAVPISILAVRASNNETSVPSVPEQTEPVVFLEL